MPYICPALHSEKRQANQWTPIHQGNSFGSLGSPSERNTAVRVGNESVKARVTRRRNLRSIRLRRRQSSRRSLRLRSKFDQRRSHLRYRARRWNTARNDCRGIGIWHLCLRHWHHRSDLSEFGLKCRERFRRQTICHDHPPSCTACRASARRSRASSSSRRSLSRPAPAAVAVASIGMLTRLSPSGPGKTICCPTGDDSSS